MIRIRGGACNRENCRSRIAPAICIGNYYYMFNIYTLISNRNRDTYRLVSTDAVVRIAAFVLTSRHVQGTYRDTYSNRCRLVRTPTQVGDAVRAD